MSRYLNNSEIEAKPLKDEKPNSKYLRIDYKGVGGNLYREHKTYPLKSYRKEFLLKLRILENDFLLKNIKFTEKIEGDAKNDNSEVVIVFAKESISSDILELLDKYLNSFNMSVVDIDIKPPFLDSATPDHEKQICFHGKEDKISLKISDLNIHCKIDYSNNYLVITSIDRNPLDSSKSFEPPYSFSFIPIEAFDPKLYLSLDRVFKEFIGFCNNQLQYIQYSNSNNYEDYKFFRQWNDVLDYQIKVNSFSEDMYHYKDININIESSHIAISLAQEDFDAISDKIEKINNKSKKHINPTINMEVKLNESDSFKYIDIGYVDDISPELQELYIKINIETAQNIIFNNRNEFILKIPTYQPALARQKNALKDFQIGKIVNPDLKAELISPSLTKSTIDSNWESIFNRDFEWQNIDLTDNQKTTIKKVLLEKNIFLIQGPPGTGKTTIIKEIAYQYLKHTPNEKILIVSQQNVAIDNALSRIYGENREWFDSSKFSFIRIAADENKVNKELKPFILGSWFEKYKTELFNNYSKAIYNNPLIDKYCKEWWSLIDKKELKEIDNEILELLLNSHNIIAATCVGLANRSIGLDLIEFDIAIIDEAGRSTPPELLIPMLRAKKVVIIGDHYQLPPQYDRKLLAALENDDDENLSTFDKEFLEKSFFERLYESLPPTNKSMLTDQFRMPKEIGNLISKLFYEGNLSNGIEKNTIDFISIKTIEWHDVKGVQQYDGTSPYNEKEIKKIYKLLEVINWSLDQRNLTKTVAIITPYSAQKRRIKEKILNLKLNKISNIKVDTVDSFQGEEAHIVIYSTVRTKGNLSFLIDRKRLNVAISRTQENLIFVGDKKFLENAKVNGKINLFSEIIKDVEFHQNIKL